MKTVFGFDFGIKKIGIAVGNNLSNSAQPLATISHIKTSPDWVTLDKLINQWAPEIMVVGLPLNMDGSGSDLSKKATKFGACLAKRYTVTVEYEDERLSSSAADHILRAQLKPKQGLSQKMKQKRDQIAAQLILQSYFDRL